MLDHVLDKGIVIDAWLRVSLAGIDLVTVDARVVVASIATYLGYSNELLHADTLSRTFDVEARRGQSVESQLRRACAELEVQQLVAHIHRRVEDRMREELRDARSRTIITH